jgi:hypothetical protein
VCGNEVKCNSSHSLSILAHRKLKSSQNEKNNPRNPRFNACISSTHPWSFEPFGCKFGMLCLVLQKAQGPQIPAHLILIEGYHLAYATQMKGKDGICEKLVK